MGLLLVLSQHTDNPTTRGGLNRAQFNRVSYNSTTPMALASAITGQIKVWNGSAWVAKPVKVWNGSGWVIKPVKRWNGSAWVVTPY